MRLLSILFVVAVPFTVQAAPYGSAGCGLGSIVFGDDPGIVQVLAATTNGTFYSQTFGITSGTSNCVDSTATASLDQQAFVKINYASLMKDAAQGEGEYLSAFATLLGCESTVRPELFELSKTRHGDWFNESTTPNQTLDTIKKDVASQQTLANSCSRL